MEHNYIDLGQGAPLPFGGASPLEDHLLRNVREFCTTWGRAVKTICLYPPTNPLPDEFRGKFYEVVTALLEMHSPIVLTTFEGEFRFDGQTVYTSGPNEENLAEIFFRDGIREIALSEGLTRDEADRLLDIIAQAVTSTETTVDIANRFWEAGFDHIKHYAVDRVVEGTYIELADERQLTERHRGFVGVETGGEVATGPLGPEEAVPAEISPYAGVQRERHLHVLKVFGDVTRLNADEREAVVGLGTPESDRDCEELALNILSEIMRAAEDTRTIDEAIAVVQRQFDHCTQAGRWELALNVLELCRDLETEAPPQAAQRLTAAMTRLADKRHFERLAQYLNANPQANLEPLRQMLTLLGPNAITAITAMLASLEHRPARMMVCDFLATCGRETVDLIGGFIYDKRWYVVRNIAMILGDIGHERALTFLRKSAAHPDVRVRLETLRAIRRFQSPEAESLLRGFLRDPDAELRKRALRAIGETNATGALADIKAQIDPSNLVTHDPGEVRELLSAYARLGGSEAAEVLMQMTRRSPLLGRARWQPIRQAVVYALAASSDPRVIGELEILSKDKSDPIAQAARAVLSRRHQADDETDHVDEAEEVRV